MISEARGILTPVVCAASLLLGCGTGADLPFVSLEPPLPGSVATEEHRPDVVRIGVAPIFSSVSTFEQYAPLISYLAYELGRDVVLTQRSTYHEMNELVRQGRVHGAFICSGAYVLNGQGLDLLVVPVLRGEPRYRAVCLANAGAELRSLQDLEGRVLATTDPLSFTGRAYVMARMDNLGLEPSTFLGRQVEVLGHDTLIRQIADGQVDAGCVNSFVVEQIQRDEPELMARLRIIEESAAFGAPPFVVTPDLDLTSRTRLLQAMLGAADHPDGRAALAPLGVERFAIPPDGLYDDLVALLGQETED